MEIKMRVGSSLLVVGLEDEMVINELMVEVDRSRWEMVYWILGLGGYLTCID